MLLGLLVLVVAVALVAAFVALATFASPGWPFPVLGVVLGLLPFAQPPLLPGTLLLLAVLLCWCSLVTREHRLPPPIVPLVLGALLVLTGALSLVATGVAREPVADFLRWAIATSVVVPLAACGPELRATTARAFVGGATLAGALGVVLLAVDPAGRSLVSLGVVERDPFGGNLRAFRYADGDAVARLTSVWLDPNIAALMMSGALLLGLALMRGWARLLCAAVLLLAITLTFSRAAYAGLALGGLLLVVLGGTPARLRARLAVAGVALAAALLAVPGVLARLLASFSPSDVGSRARWEALAAFPGEMGGHWLFGRGWGLPELVDGAVARVSNHPANVPLLTLYRGGILMALVMVVLLGWLAHRGWRLLRRPTFEESALGAGLLGLVLVTFQLDFPVVTILPAVVLLGLLLVHAHPGSPPSAASPATGTASPEVAR